MKDGKKTLNFQDNSSKNQMSLWNISMTTDGDRNFDYDLESIRLLVEDAIQTNNELYIAHLINKLLTEYQEIATIVTENKYKKTSKKT